MSALERDEALHDMTPDSPDGWDDPALAERYRVTDDASAGWALRKLAKVRAEMQRDSDLVADEVDRLKTWLRGRNDSRQRSVDFFEGLLRDWFERCREDDPTLKSKALPWGKVSARKVGATVKVVDVDALVCHVGLDSPLVRVKAEGVAVALKQAVLVDGEALPGVEVVPERESVTVATEQVVDVPTFEDDPF